MENSARLNDRDDEVDCEIYVVIIYSRLSIGAGG